MEQKVLTEYRIKNEEETRAFALALAQKLAAGDVLALCGKGHEDYQVIDGVTENQQSDFYDRQGIYGRQTAALSF